MCGVDFFDWSEINLSNNHRISYLMHVDWGWIKQRPHFLYEELTKYFRVDLFYIEKLYGNKNRLKNCRNVNSKSNVLKIRKLPLSGKHPILRDIEKLINFPSYRLLKSYDYVWITSPLLLDFVPRKFLDGKVIIYDCMDDFLGFYEGDSRIDRLRELEVDLVQNADIVFTSSAYLKQKLISSYSSYLKSPPIVINNGISTTLFADKEVISRDEQVIVREEHITNLMFIGTVGDWIDFELIISLLEQIPYLIFTIIGPIETKVPAHSRINYIGVVEHSKIRYYADLADAFIMPFKLNELVRAVDPVKIYEYIYFRKPILAIDYEEMHKFLPFVLLYSSEEEVVHFLIKIRAGEYQQHSEESIMNFLNKNTWNVRCREIADILKGADQ